MKIDFKKLISILKRDQKGVALILSLILMVLLLLLTISAFEMVTVNAQIADNHIRDLQALYIADAGIEDAIWRIRTGTSGNFLYYDISCGDGNYDYKVIGNKIASRGEIYGSSRAILAEYEVIGMSIPYTVLIDSWKEITLEEWGAL